MKKLLLTAVIAGGIVCGAFGGDSIAARMRAIAQFSDEICSITNVSYLSSYDSSAITSEFEVNMGDEDIAAKGGYTRVIYVLKPEAASDDTGRAGRERPTRGAKSSAGSRRTRISPRSRCCR